VEAGGVITVKAGGALRVEAGSIVEIAPNWQAVAGTTFAISNNESGKTLKTTSGSAVSVSVPAGLSIAPVTIYQSGAGQVTFVAGGGVTIRTSETLQLAKQYAVATLFPTDIADEYALVGYLAAAS
jgi:hypothetical protein